MNTWGDALVCAFRAAGSAAAFALRLLRGIECIDWTRVGLPEDTTARVGLHAGPVDVMWDR
jgi:hypothetical protein